MYDSIYLLQTRESLFKNENVFKIGRTSQDELKRFNSYPRGSKLHLHVSCFDGVKVEKQIITLFMEKYTNAHIYGSEYFHGNLSQMMSDVLKIIGYNFDTVMDSENFTKIFLEKDNIINDLTQRLHKEQEKSKYLQQQICNLQKKCKDFQNCLIGDNVNSLETSYAMNTPLGSDHKDVVTTFSDCAQNDVNECNNNELVQSVDNVMVKCATDNNDDRLVLKCEKCNKIFTRQSYLRKHIESCNGLSKLQCEICHKFFKNRQGKYEHKNNVKCYPPTTNKFEFNSLNHLIPKM